MRSIIVVVLCLFPFTVWPAKLSPITHLFDLERASGKNIELPTDVAVNSNFVYVLDGVNNRVIAFSHDGNFAFAFGDKLEFGPLLNRPVGLFANNRHILVADTANYLVRIYDTKGRFQTSFPIRNGKEAERPIDVALNKKGDRIFVTCNLSHKVKIYNRQGTLLKSLGKRGPEKGRFQYPATIANLGNNKKVIVDVLNARAQVFSDTGKFLRQISSQGVVPGKLFRPKGVAVDSKNRIYISDSFTNVIHVFNEFGKFKYLLGNNQQIKRFTGPVGMSIHKNRLYVTESLANKVSVYKLN